MSDKGAKEMTSNRAEIQRKAIEARGKDRAAAERLDRERADGKGEGKATTGAIRLWTRRGK